MCHVQAEKRVTSTEEQFERMSRTLRAEVDRWSAERVTDFIQTLHKFAETQLMTQQQVRSTLRTHTLRPFSW
jgi:hypothetical protein